jgi:hypothetical protein
MERQRTHHAQELVVIIADEHLLGASRLFELLDSLNEPHLQRTSESGGGLGHKVGNTTVWEADMDY